MKDMKEREEIFFGLNFLRCGGASFVRGVVALLRVEFRRFQPPIGVERPQESGQHDKEPGGQRHDPEAEHDKDEVNHPGGNSRGVHSLNYRRLPEVDGLVGFHFKFFLTGLTG